MDFSVGIAIVTYNRKNIVSDTIDRVRAFTQLPNTALVVADDGSSDGTLSMLRDKQVPVVTGLNMGIAWNKNRALFLLSQMLRCETVILLEDDTQPNKAGWEAEWIQGSRQWGHVNIAHDWMTEHFLFGAGTAKDPVRSKRLTAQCAAFSSVALTFGGYFDPHFRGYGHEHVDHSRRLVRVGYGGSDEMIDGQERVLYYLIKGDLTVVSSKSHYDEKQVQLNFEFAQQNMGRQHFRAPWADDLQLRQFRAETESAMREGPERFRLTPAELGGPASQQAKRGLFTRWLARTDGTLRSQTALQQRLVS